MGTGAPFPPLTVTRTFNESVACRLVTAGEICVGASLLLGCFTRAGAFVGLFLVLNYFFGIGMARGGAMLAQQQTFAVSLVIFILSNPGRVLGLDGLLFRGKARGAR